MRKLTFIKNAMILTVTALLLRTIGMFFRIYLSNKIGAEGMGLYQLVFSIYLLASTFATSGISTAVTRMIADEMGRSGRKPVLKILRRALIFSIGVALLSTAIVFFGADLIGSYCLQDERAVLALKVLSLSLPFMGISSCLRGYFIAQRRVSCSSNAQIFEQLVRVAVVLLLIDRFLPMGIGYACAAIMIGDTVAETASCGYLYIGYLRDRGKLGGPGLTEKGPDYAVFPRLCSIALPIAAGRYLNTALRTIENLMVPDRLTRFGGSKERALEEFGMLKGMAMPVLFFPSSFLSALSTLLVPEISQAAALRQRRTVNAAVNRSLHLTLASAIFLSGIFAIFGGEIGELVYHSGEVGLLIRVLAPLMPFMYMESVVEGILRGLNQQVSTLRYSVIDSLCRIAMIVVLVPRMGMQGFLLVMVVSNLLTAWLNLRRLLSVTGLPMQWGKWVVKPVVSITAAALFALTFEGRFLEGTPLALSLAIPFLLALLIYAIMVVLTGCVSREDLGFLKKKR